jgi:hypothetical protein
MSVTWNLYGPTGWEDRLEEGDLVGLDAEIYGKLVVTKLICATYPRLAQPICLSKGHSCLCRHNKQMPSDFRIRFHPLFLR